MSDKGRRRLRDGREVSVHANQGVRKVCGCPWRNWSKCPHAWHFSYSWRGRHYRFSLSRYLAREVIGRTEAQAAADKIRVAIRDGTFSFEKAPAPSGPSTGGGGGGLTFEAYGELFMKGYSKDRGKASWQDDRYLVRRVRWISKWPATSCKADVPRPPACWQAGSRRCRKPVDVST
jgi:hypothetical protein